MTKKIVIACAIFFAFQAPIFAAIHDVRDYGAKADGKTDDTIAIQNAIDKASPGDTVLLRIDRTFLCGPIYLKSDLTLEINGTLLGVTDLQAYLPHRNNRYEGIIVQAPQSLINVGELDPSGEKNIRNVIITGKGCIDPRGFEVYKQGPNLRGNAIQVDNCDGFELTGLSKSEALEIREGMRWTIHTTFSDHIKFQHLKIDTTDHEKNSDGIDVDSCSYVLIKDVKFRTADDCIAIKSGKDIEGYNINIPASYITIEDCEFEHKSRMTGKGAVAFGSEGSGGIHHVTIRNCTTVHPVNRFIFLKTRPGRGGHSKYHDILVENCQDIHTTRDMIYITTAYINTPPKEPAPGTPDIGGNIKFMNVSGTSDRKAVNLIGANDMKIHDIIFENCDFNDESITGEFCEDISFENCLFGREEFTNSTNINFGVLIDK
jgi:exo-poly-alpha-galacturonosidase